MLYLELSMERTTTTLWLINCPKALRVYGRKLIAALTHKNTS